MTTETYLDLTFDRSAKGGKRPLRPKLLKLTDAALPRRNRKKTKTKSKDRSLSSVRDRIYDDPAYTDDISHLANPLRPRSYERRSSNVEMKTENLLSGTLTTAGGSLDKRGKLAKEFLLYANKHVKAQNYIDSGGGAAIADADADTFGHDCSSSSDEHTHAEVGKTNSINRRGRSLDRSVLEKSEKRRERAAKQQQRNSSIANCQEGNGKTHGKTDRKFQATTASKSYNEKVRKTWNEPSPDIDVASTSNASGSKMHIGRRFLRGEIGIKSFNYYLLKEGLKSSKRLVGKQRSSTTTVDRSPPIDKKSHSRSEENIYEEIFFKDASASDEENQNETNALTVSSMGQEHEPQGMLLTTESTPDSQAITDNDVFPNCDLCVQHCSKENCEYCYIDQPDAPSPQAGTTEHHQHGTKISNQSPSCMLKRRQYDNGINQVGNTLKNAIIKQDHQMNAENGNNNLPAAHILEFQSYNPNNPGVYKIETTPVAITGEYNPVLQFQQSSTASSTATTTPSDRQQSYAQLKAMSQPNRHGASENLVGGGLVLQTGQYCQGNMLPLLSGQTRQRLQRLPAGQQQYILSYNGSTPRITTNFGTNAKSSSSSDSLQQHKFNTVARMDSNVPYNDPFYGGIGGGGIGIGGNSGFVHMHPLIYASSRPLGGSQILLDPYEQTPHIYKSDSRASILSEYSLRSSDNSHRYGRYLQHRGGGGRGEVSDSSLGDSLFSCASTQRRYFGSSESCRFGFECRRCSLDSGAISTSIGVGLGIGVGVGVGVGAGTGEASAGTGVAGNNGGFGSGSGSGEKCSFSDACRYDCRNCDCSSSYFSSDFDDVYGSGPGGSIPRKTAAGILPSNSQPPDYDRLEEQMERKQNKYAKDFFKHVNDVKRSIYQSEMQRNGSLETNSNKVKSKKQLDSNNGNDLGSDSKSSMTITECPKTYTTLPLTKDRNGRPHGSTNAVNAKLSEANSLYKPVAAPRTSLQHSKSHSVNTSQLVKDSSEYPSLDRLIATAATTGAIPKTTLSIVQSYNTNDVLADSQINGSKNDPKMHFISESNKPKVSHVSRQSPKREKLPKRDFENQQTPEVATSHSVKEKSATGVVTSNTKKDRYLTVSSVDATSVVSDVPPIQPKRHHRTSTAKTSGASISRRRDMPAAPPPSPATYSDLQELKANLESMQDDTKSPKRAESLESTVGITDKELQKSETDSTAASEAIDGYSVPQTPISKKSEKSNGKDTEGGVSFIKPSNPTVMSLIDTEEDDVFYDARSEDSGGTPAMTTTIPKRTSNKKNETKTDDDCMVEQNVLHQQMHEDKSSKIQSNKVNISVGSKDDQQVEDKENATNSFSCKQSKSDKEMIREHERVIEKQSKKDKDDSSKRSSETKKTTTTTIIKSNSKQRNCGDCSQIATNDIKSTKKTTKIENTTKTMATNTTTMVTTDTTMTTATATTMTTTTTTPTPTITSATITTKMAKTTAMALNPGEENDVATIKKSTITKETVIKSNDETTTMYAIGGTTKARKHGERRSKSSVPRQQHQQITANSSRQATMAMLAISCDTCCQIECDEIELKKQNQMKNTSSNRTWRLKAERDRTTTTTTSIITPNGSSNKERANKIKQVETKTKTPTSCAVVTKPASLPQAITTTDTQNHRRLQSPGTDTDTGTAISTGNSNENVVAATCTLENIENHIGNIKDTDKAKSTPIDLATSTLTSTSIPTPTTLNYDNTVIVETATKETEEKAKTDNESATDEAERKAVAPNHGSQTTTTTTTSTTSFTISCNSDIAGVATLSNSGVEPISTLSALGPQTKKQLGNHRERKPLQRQDYSCLDSSEAQSDDSHLTRDSITRESQNDELSSSTLDKIDVSGLPLPALPPKKRRTRQRASPSKHHHSRTRHEVEQQGSELQSNPVSASTTLLNVVDVSESQHLSAFQQYVAKRRESLEASSRSFNEKLEARRKMHYHMATAGGGGVGGVGSVGSVGSVGGGIGGGTPTLDASYGYMPTYLFGENYCSGSKRNTNAPLAREEIFLNKSGWVQVNKRAQNESRNSYRHYPRSNGNVVDSADMRNAIRVIQIDDNRRSDKARKALLQHQHSMMVDAGGYAVPKFVVSKVEELIKRNEARLSNAADNPPSRDPPLRPGYRIVDQQIANILNERPGFLPVRNPGDADSPPPITPILSPPPAFQDSSKSKRIDRRKPISTNRQPWALPLAPIPPTGLYVGSTNTTSGSGKGMVFSRSFEYDMRRPTPTDNYVETFSRSFDGNLSERPMSGIQRERSPNFSSLTGNSPNYLTKKDSGGGSSGSLRSRDSSPKYQQVRSTAYLNTSVKEAPPAYSVASSTARHSPRNRRERSFERSKNYGTGLSRSRKAQFGRMGSAGVMGTEKSYASGMSRFRSFDTAVNQRLNSCDSGARSDLSNDELDNDDDIGGSTEFLTVNYHHNISPIKKQRQRSLTPERNESRSSSGSLRKQRSLTPESRSLTPEDRRKKGSQASLMPSRQNSGSRSNTLERKQCSDDKGPCISRSSSSSSYSGSREREPQGNVSASMAASAGGAISLGAQHRRSLGRSAKQTEEHRIRRSRSLQLSERSPNRSHNALAYTAAEHASSHNHSNSNTIYQQSGAITSGQQNNFPVIMRPSGKSQPLLVDNSGSSTGSRSRNNDMDKSHSFDFDYNYYNSIAGASSRTHGSGNINSSKQNVPVHLDLDKSRSFDDDYREAINANNNVKSNTANQSLRYLQTGDTVVNVRYRKTSPSGGIDERSTRSPQQSGSPCSNFRLQRKTTSPQNYGTRLCDHELTYDKLRKSLDRSPIMDFCQGGDGNDYDIPQHLSRNRETINFGGNSELNFMNNESFIYETPTTTSTSSLKQQRSLGQSQSTNETPYATSEAYRQVTHHHGQQSQQQSQTQSQQREPRSNNRGSQRSIRRNPNFQIKTVLPCSVYPYVTADCHSINESFEVLKKVPYKSKTLHSVPMMNIGYTCGHKSSLKVKNLGIGPQTLKTARRNKSPWKLLCSGATPVPSNNLERVNNKPIKEGPSFNDHLRNTEMKKSPIMESQIKNFVSQTQIKLTSTTSISIQDDSSSILDNKEFEGVNVKIQVPMKEKFERKQFFKSASLPNLLTENGDSCRRRKGFKKSIVRAVSSPSLVDHFEEDGGESHAINAKCSSARKKRTNSFTNLKALQKFKRSLVGVFSSQEPLYFPKELTDASTQYPPLTTSLLAIDDESTSVVVDSTACKNRFGVPIWRSSRERRKTKSHRTNKCYSADSGIQVELDLDDKRSREMVKPETQEFSVKGAYNKNKKDGQFIDSLSMQHLMDTEFGTQTQNIRRTHSMKSTGADRKISGFMKSMPPQRDISQEREAPDSLPTRSISHPYGLEGYSANKPEFDCSDGNSLGSNNEGGNYYPVLAEVLYNFTAVGPQELGLERGTLIEILRKEAGQWWFGRIRKEGSNLVEEILDPELGWFPKDFVRIIPFPETDTFLLNKLIQAPQSECTSPPFLPKPEIKSTEKHMPSSTIEIEKLDRNNVTTIIIESPPLTPTAIATEKSIPFTDNMPIDNSSALRVSAVKELLSTEANYVKLLASICEGYLPALTRRIDIFSPNSIRLIFSNITDIYSFQQSFLFQLRKGIEQEQIAKVFLKMHKGFLCYSTYCNAYPRALIELESYDRMKDARIIFENCRKSEKLTEFPLAAHLLSPVQRICRYPLHLSEILKMTSNDREDFQNDEEIKDKMEQLERLDASQVDMPDTHRTIEMALEAMKGITEAVNEGKRHSETISRHQSSFQNFKGPPLHLHSTRFFLQIDATRQKQNLWNSSYTLFLFDNQLIYCKRDVLKRSQFIYKGRIFLDRCRIVNVRDGKMFGQTIKNALRIYCEARDKWYDFCFRSSNRKQKFLHTLALERQFGGKALYVSEMTGFDYALRERSSGNSTGTAEISDQSDYEFPDTEYSGGGSGGNSRNVETLRDINSSGGNTSLPGSPSKLSVMCGNVTLPKKSKSRDFIGFQDENQTGSLGRRRLGNWFRKPKSSNSTPNLSPKHKPLISIPLVTQSKKLQLGVINRLGNTSWNQRHSTEV